MADSTLPELIKYQHQPMNSAEFRTKGDDDRDQLVSDLNKASLRKGLDAQLTEHTADWLAAKVQTKIDAETSHVQNDVYREYERTNCQKKYLRQHELKDALDQQVEDKRVKRNIVLEEERGERKQLVELDHITEVQDQSAKVTKKELMARQLDNLLITESESDRDESDLEGENDRDESDLAGKNESYIRELELLDQQLRELRMQVPGRREAAVVAVTNLLLDMEDERAERHKQLADVLLQHIRFETELEEKEAELKRRQNMNNLAEALEEQIRTQKENEKRFLEQEKQFVNDVMNRLMESETMERLSAEGRRRRMLNYRQELNGLMLDRKQARFDEQLRVRNELEMEQCKRETIL